MLRLSRKATILSYLFLNAFWIAAPAGAEPVITFSSGAVTVSGATKGSAVAVFGVAVGRAGFLGRQERYAAILFDPDADGMVSYPLSGSVPPNSVWFAVDLDNGDNSQATPDAGRFAPDELTVFEVEELRLPGNLLLYHLETVEVLYVRHGAQATAGAWSVRAHEGGPFDQDGLDNGVLRLPLRALEPLDDSPPAPTEIAEGDLVVSVDPFRLASAVRVISFDIP